VEAGPGPFVDLYREIAHTVEKEGGWPGAPPVDLLPVVGKPVLKILPDSTSFTDSLVVSITTLGPAVEIRYTLDGTEPSATSALYSGPFEVTRSVTVKAAAFYGTRTNRNPTVTMKRSTVKARNYKRKLPQVTLKPIAVDPASLQTGLAYLYYGGVTATTGASGHEMPQFDPAQAYKKGMVDSITLSPKVHESDFAFKYDGYIKIDQTGAYTFTLASDDGSQLFIDNELVVDNNGVHGVVAKTGQVNLAAGFHRITVTYFDAGGAAQLVLNYKGPGVSEQEVPASVLYHEK